MSKSTSQDSFGDLSYHDVVAMIMNTAVVAKRDHPVMVREAKISGKKGVLVFMPGYEMVSGKLRKLEDFPLVANGEDDGEND